MTGELVELDDTAAATAPAALVETTSGRLPTRRHIVRLLVLLDWPATISTWPRSSNTGH
jgi:hypothetical protein